MGEMTIRLDEALALALRQRADALGSDMDQVVADLLRSGLAGHRDRAAVARGILARSQPAVISSVDLLDQIRG